MPIYEYRCPECGMITERFVHTFAQADKEVCTCGTLLNREINPSRIKVDVWNHTHIEELGNIHIRGMKHAREVARAQGLNIDTTPINKVDFDYLKRREEKELKHPVYF